MLTKCKYFIFIQKDGNVSVKQTGILIFLYPLIGQQVMT